MSRGLLSAFCVLVLGGVLLVGSCRDTGQGDRAVTYSVRVVGTYPHDPRAFTQGLAFEDGFLYEGTGLRGGSSLRKVDLTSGVPLVTRNLPDEYFGEGITIFEGRIIQLTWESGVGFVYDKETFKKLDEFQYEGEGWGITHDGQRLIMSDGTDVLRFLDAETFEQIGTVGVREGDTPISNLNELEYINGQVYANVWETTRIAIIEPGSGAVTGWIDLKEIYTPTGWAAEAKIPNGIACDHQNGRLFVTGKLWPNVFQIEISGPNE